MTSETYQISDREREILRLVATGATNQQIAHQLNISVNTVKVHLRNIFSKIGATSRTEATIYAIQHGLVRVGFESRAEPSIDTPIDTEPETLVPDYTPALDAPAAELAVVDQVDTLVGSNLSETQAIEPQAVVISKTSGSFNRRLIVIFTVVGLIVAGAAAYFFLQQRPAVDVLPTPAPATGEGDRWKTRAPLAVPRSDFAVAAYEGKLYVIGGTGASGVSAAVERYDPANDLSVSLDDKPTAVTQVQAVTVGGRIYVPGGEDKEGKVLGVFEGYDPRSQRWETLPELPAPRSRYALATVEGRIYLFGGWDGSAYHAEVFAYDPETKTWSSRSSMPTARRTSGAAVIDDRVYVVGGENESGALRANERYDPAGDNGGQWDSRAPLPTASGTPAVAGIGSAGLLVFDPQLRAGLQYDPNKDAWINISVREGVDLSTRVAPLGVSVFVFGPAAQPSQEVGVSEYKALYTTFIPNPGVGH